VKIEPFVDLILALAAIASALASPSGITRNEAVVLPDPCSAKHWLMQKTVADSVRRGLSPRRFSPRIIRAGVAPVSAVRMAHIGVAVLS